ncbi:MAG: sugar phosphate isomerase/epimerase [Clostridia bacterium]|nr:sugar phosphate isomerase/epimerase [Clostridia bacterium]
MNLKYSVFLGNVGHCFDRYCPEYSTPFSLEELFTRAVSIPQLSAVDLVMDWGMMEKREEIKAHLARTGLAVGSLAVDTFANPLYKKGSLSSTDKAVRDRALADCKAVMDFAAEIDCKIVTLWPGQDGYDYIFAADYIKERQLFADGVAELCRYNPNIIITLEYKIKEPRTHSYISTVGATLLMIEKINLPNLGIALDYGHAALGYETAAEAVAMCKMYGDRLKHIHINDNYRLWDDDMIVGTVHSLEYLEFFYWLKRTGYEGYLVIDQFPYREDGRDAVAESAEWLDALIALTEKIDANEAEAVIAKRDGVAASKFMRKILFKG